jgi:hypothetical protein
VATNKIFGVIEGFYGTPWSHEDRLACIDFLEQSGGNTYVWAAKQEPRHRDQWSEPFTQDERESFAQLAGRSSRVQLAVGITPGEDATPEQLIQKLEPARDAGCSVVVLSFDDLPVLDAAGQHQYLAHKVLHTLQLPVWIVPTHYAGTTSSKYLERLCAGLDTSIEVMWTGNAVVTETITAAEARARQTATGNRPPLLWDNTPVNDARMRGHLHLGPYMGREEKLRDVCSGILVNPMEEFRASLATMTSASAWFNGQNHVEVWREYVEQQGLMVLAQATAYRGDDHWPGESPSRQWWESVAQMSVDDPQLEPWVSAAQQGARLALIALSVLEAPAPLSEREKSSALLRLMGWGQYTSRAARTFGGGPRIRPIATQDHDGKFVFDSRSISESASLVDDLVRQALRVLER